MFRSTMATLFLLGAVAAARAHFPFVIPEGDGSKAIVVFSDALEPDTRVNIDKLSPTKLKLRDTAGNVSDLEWTKGESRLLVNVPGTGSRVVLSHVADVNTIIESVAAPDYQRHQYTRRGVLQPGMYRLQAEATAIARTTPPDVGAVAEAPCSMQFHAEAIPCPADWDADGRVDSNDLFAFLRDFFGAGADFNADGQSNSLDLFDFLSLLLSGC